jgi:transcriptional regulator with XRE-family HTH domain
MEPSKFSFETVGSNIRKHRLSKQIKQEYLAKKTELSKSEISRLENGLRDTTIKKLLKLAVALNIHPSELFEE